MKRLKLMVPIAAILLVSACRDSTSDLPPEPAIEYISTAVAALNENESTVITISFEDGDGDLGTPDALVPDCTLNPCDLTSDSSCINDPAWTAFLIDSRDNCLRLKKIPFFEPNGKTNEVVGEMDIDIGPIACKCQNTCTTDTVSYEVFVKDQAGNESNRVFSETITVTCN